MRWMLQLMCLTLVLALFQQFSEGCCKINMDEKRITQESEYGMCNPSTLEDDQWKVCAGHQTISSIRSAWDSDSEDREWTITCRNINQNQITGAGYDRLNSANYWTPKTRRDKVIDFESEMQFGQGGQWLLGFGSKFGGRQKDREFIFKFGRKESSQMRRIEDYIEYDGENDEKYQGSMCENSTRKQIRIQISPDLSQCRTRTYQRWSTWTFEIPENYGIRSVWSEHTNSSEDRIWRFTYCPLVVYLTSYPVGRHNQCNHPVYPLIKDDGRK